MPLVFLHEADESGKRIDPEKRLEDFLRWFLPASTDERWDARLLVTSNTAFKKACSLLDVPPDPYLDIEVSPVKAASQIAGLLAHGGRSGSLQVVAGARETPILVTLALPPGAEDELDRSLRHVVDQSGEDPWSAVQALGFTDWARGPEGPSDRLQRAYEAATVATNTAIPFREWCASVATRTGGATGPSPVWCSLLSGTVPIEVDVDGAKLSQGARDALLESWFALLPEALRIKAKGRFSDETLRAAGLSGESSTRPSGRRKWELDTISLGKQVQRDAVIQAFHDPNVTKSLRMWQLRARDIHWKIPDRSLLETPHGNAIALVQTPHQFRRTIRITFALEDVDSPRFLSAVRALRAHVPAETSQETAWVPTGDPEHDERGRAQRVRLSALREAVDDFLYRRAGGFLSEFVGSVRETVAHDLPKRPVEIRRALLAKIPKELPGFAFDPDRSKIGAKGWLWDQYVFVRRRPSGTRNLISFIRERDPYYPRRLDIRLGASAVGGAICAPWGLEVDTTQLGWTRIPCQNQEVFDRALDRAVKRLRKDTMAFFDETEPHLLALRSFART